MCHMLLNVCLHFPVAHSISLPPSLPDLTVPLHFPVGECHLLTPIPSLPDLLIHRTIGECSHLLHFPPVLTARLSALSQLVSALACSDSLPPLPAHPR